jgi:hypothetical protein
MMPEMRSTVAFARLGAKGKSASASSATFPYRCRRSFSRHLPTIASSALGTSGRTLRIDGVGSVVTLMASSITESARNAVPAGHQLEEDNPQGPDVRLRVDVLRGAHLLGRHVEWRAHQGGRARHRPRSGSARVGHLRDPEVEDFDRELPVRTPHAEQVCRLEVAVHDSERVRVGDGDTSLKDEIDGLFDGKGPTLFDPGVEIPALEVLHHHVRRAVGERAHVGHASDVLALDLYGGARLTSEPGDRLGVAEGVGQ